MRSLQCLWLKELHFYITSPLFVKMSKHKVQTQPETKFSLNSLLVTGECAVVGGNLAERKKSERIGAELMVAWV